MKEITEISKEKHSRRGRHFANVGDVIIYSDLVVARTGKVPSTAGFSSIYTCQL